MKASYSALALTAVNGALARDGPTPKVNNNPVASYQAVLPEQSFADLEKSIHGTITASVPRQNAAVQFVLNLYDLTPDILPLSYHIHAKAVPEGGNCTATEGHLNPYDADAKCDKSDFSRCEAGDLSGKYGVIDKEQLREDGTYIVAFQDDYLSLNPSDEAYFGDLSIVFHLPDEKKSRATCANFSAVGAEGDAACTDPGNGGDSGSGSSYSTDLSSATGVVPPPADPTDVGPPADPTDAVPPAEPTDAVPPAEPTDAVPPAEPTDAVPPADPTDAVPPADPTDAVPPADPTDAVPPGETSVDAIPTDGGYDTGEKPPYSDEEGMPTEPGYPGSSTEAADITESAATTGAYPSDVPGEDDEFCSTDDDIPDMTTTAASSYATEPGYNSETAGSGTTDVASSPYGESSAPVTAPEPSSTIAGEDGSGYGGSTLSSVVTSMTSGAPGYDNTPDDGEDYNDLPGDSDDYNAPMSSGTLIGGDGYSNTLTTLLPSVTGNLNEEFQNQEDPNQVSSSGMNYGASIVAVLAALFVAM